MCVCVYALDANFMWLCIRPEVKLAYLQLVLTFCLIVVHTPNRRYMEPSHEDARRIGNTLKETHKHFFQPSTTRNAKHQGVTLWTVKDTDDCPDQYTDD